MGCSLDGINGNLIPGQQGGHGARGGIDGIEGFELSDDRVLGAVEIGKVGSQPAGVVRCVDAVIDSLGSVQGFQEGLIIFCAVFAGDGDHWLGGFYPGHKGIAAVGAGFGACDRDGRGGAGCTEDDGVVFGIQSIQGEIRSSHFRRLRQGAIGVLRAAIEVGHARL